MKITTTKWDQRLASNNSYVSELDGLIGEYSSKRLGFSEDELKDPNTHYELSNLANNVTKAATFHALKGKKHLWNIAKDYSKKSKSHKETAKQLEYGTQENLF
jgi:hypothetical protein